MNEKIKEAIEEWILRVLESRINTSPEELAILPDMINLLKFN